MRSIDGARGNEDPVDLFQGNSQKTTIGRPRPLELDKITLSGDGELFEVLHYLRRGPGTYLDATLGDGWWSGYVGWQETRARNGSL